MAPARYAINVAPAEGSALERFARAWAGRDPATNAAVPQPRLSDIAPPRLAEITADIRRYAVHGTLKPPFALALGREPADLAAALARFAASRAPVLIPPLRLAALNGYLVLRPDGPTPALADLAADVVRTFEPFRRRDPEEEAERLARGDLTPRQVELLRAWGYPYVLDEFTFHLTLTGRLHPDERDRVAASLAPLVEPLARAPFRVDTLGLFVEPAPGEPFRLVERHTLGSPTPRPGV